MRWVILTLIPPPPVCCCGRHGISVVRLSLEDVGARGRIETKDGAQDVLVMDGMEVSVVYFRCFVIICCVVCAICLSLLGRGR